NGPHQPTAEPVPGAAVTLPGQARRDQLAVGKAPAAQVPGQVLPGLRRVADAEPLDIGELEAAFGQEGAGRRGVGSAQPFGVKFGRCPMRVYQPAPLALFLARVVTTLLVAEVDARPRGQPLDRLDEGQAVDLLHEPDRVATFGARETVEKSSRRRHIEGGGLLVVERAQSLERAAARVPM